MPLSTAIPFFSRLHLSSHSLRSVKLFSLYTLISCFASCSEVAENQKDWYWYLTSAASGCSVLSGLMRPFSQKLLSFGQSPQSPP